MTNERFSFGHIEQQVRKKTYCVLSTIDPKNRPHSTGIIYGVSTPEDKFALYMLTVDRYAKVQNIRKNPNISLVVNFPHYYVRFAPDSYIMFRGTAELVPFEDDVAQRAFRQKRILRMNLDSDPEQLKGAVFIKLIPEPTVFCFGVGIGILELLKAHVSSDYKVEIPQERL